MAIDIERQLVDPEKLGEFLRDRLPGEGEFVVTRHQAGHSCETFFLERGGARWALRRPPLAVYLPTAHDVLREYRVLSALAETNVRAPRPVLVCEDPAVIGAPFYVMEKVDGEVIRSEIPPALDNAPDRRRIGAELAEAIADLHNVDYTKAGLEGFGKPTGYVERQVRRWTGQLELATSITKESREVPEMWQVRDWLRANSPESSRSVVVHGDYKLDNVAYAADSPAQLVSIFDWEMSTIGDPLADLGWMVSFWRQADDPIDPLHEDLSRITSKEGFMTRDELIEVYSERTGIAVG